MLMPEQCVQLTYGSEKSNGCAGGDGHGSRRSKLQLRESFYGQGWITRRTGGDKSRGQRVYLVYGQGGVKWLGKWGFLAIGA